MNKEATPRFSYEDLVTLNMQVNSLKNTNLSVESITNLIKLKVELKGVIEMINESVKALFEGKYGLQITMNEFGQQTYVFKGHKKEAEIEADNKALMATKADLKSKLNFMSYAELGATTADLPIGVVAEMATHLVKG